MVFRAQMRFRHRRWRRATLALMTVSAGIGMLSTGPASAAPAGPKTRVETQAHAPMGRFSVTRNAATGLCLTGNGRLSTRPCSPGSAFQAWDVSRSGAQGYRIQNLGSGLCLDSRGASAVTISPCVTGRASQTWNLGRNASAASMGSLNFQNDQIQQGGSSMCLESSPDAAVYTSPCDRNDLYQKWDDRV